MITNLLNLTHNCKWSAWQDLHLQPFRLERNASALGYTRMVPTASILVVEDDLDVARLIAHHLQKAGYQVRTAHTAEDAVSDIHNNLPDLITLDINLPGMQGDELARRLHDNPLTQDIPILVLSMYVDEQTGAQLGAYALSKPIDQEELLQPSAGCCTDRILDPCW